MLTCNEGKKALVQKLLDEKQITLDEAFMLLDEATNPQGIGLPTVWPDTSPYTPPSPWWGIFPPSVPDTGTITIDLSGSSICVSDYTVHPSTTCELTDILNSPFCAGITYTLN